MKQYIAILSISLLTIFNSKAQYIECIGNLIEIPLAGYKYGNIQWQFSADESNWTVIADGSEKLSYTIDQTGYFRAKITDGICEYFSDVTYIQAFPSTIANASNDINVISSSENVALNANIPDVGSGTWHIKSGTAGNLANPSDPKSNFSGVIGNKYILTWTITSDCKTTTDEVSVNFYSPLNMLSDVDGNVYNTSSIGTQVWMTENLKTSKFSNGDLIPTTKLDVQNENSPVYQWAYLDADSNAVVYGKLYTWAAVVDNRNVCPTGWHVPNDTEWTVLSDFSGGLDIAGGKLKETGTSHWKSPNTDATNVTDFSALPGGYRAGTDFFFLGNTGGWWSTDEIFIPGIDWTQPDRLEGSDWYLINTSANLRAGTFNKSYGVSVRCIKD